MVFTVKSAGISAPSFRGWVVAGFVQGKGKPETSPCAANERIPAGDLGGPGATGTADVVLMVSTVALIGSAIRMVHLSGSLSRMGS